MLQKYLRILKKLFSPHIAIIILLNIATIISLAYVFLNGLDRTVMAYVSYAISAYTLTTDVINFFPILKKIKYYKENNKYLRRYFSDKGIQIILSLYLSLFLNFVYAVFNLVLSHIDSSIWFLSVGIYYLTLGMMRLYLLTQSKNANKLLNDKKIFELKAYRFTGIAMFIINIAMSGMAIQMIWNNDGTNHSEIMTIAMAAFTFTFFSIAVVNLQKFRKTDQPIYSATKMLNFACALMSIFTLQTSMISAFGDSAESGQSMNIATGSTVFILVFGLAIYMIRRANNMIKEVKNEQ